MTAETQGHLFVVHGDLTKLSWDAVLIPCDQDKAVSSWWFRLFDTTRQPQDAWEPLPEGAGLAPRRRGSQEREPDPTAYELVDTVSPEDVEQLAEAVVSGLERLVPRLPQGAHAGRTRRLVAMPLPGTGHGVFAHRRGAVVGAVVPALVTCAERLGVDVALVMRDPRDYAAVQGATERTWSVSKELLDHADRLGELAGRGELSVFVGAGASVPLGMPSWGQLVHSLLQQAEGQDLPKGSDEVAYKAAAQRAKDALGEDRYARLLEQLFATEHHALSHGLIASLRLRQNVTTNFDTALEAAMKLTHGEDLRVMAHQWATTSGPWLLKLHGTVGKPRGVVLTTDDYVRHAEDGKPLYGLVQGLLMTSHVLFLGFSLMDSAYLELASAFHAGAVARAWVDVESAPELG
ncbi:SIR2 family protein [Ornithinicoccus hortensis]|uniref:SIR2-like protein n=1 Tax=Ornithinicoccus hortensis TaxID=82346 RepID=A0A542YRL2_9MICO|nr:SIR2 family protein [Ornithinicoccus hortensis]TQL50564.1 SIR2-like protein [Ornithinicoccus hortensis]